MGNVSEVNYNEVFGEARKFIFEDEQCVAFDELINPQAPVHFLVVPRKRMSRLTGVTAEDQKLLGHLLLVARRIAIDKGVARTGFRVVVNDGPYSGQRGDQVCVHVLGGRQMTWPFS